MIFTFSFTVNLSSIPTVFLQHVSVVAVNACNSFPRRQVLGFLRGIPRFLVKTEHALPYDSACLKKKKTRNRWRLQLSGSSTLQPLASIHEKKVLSQSQRFGYFRFGSDTQSFAVRSFVERTVTNHDEVRQDDQIVEDGSRFEYRGYAYLLFFLCEILT